MRYYRGLAVGGPLTGQMLERETPQFHISKPQVLSSKSMADLMTKGAASANESVETATYVHHTIEVRYPHHSGRTNFDLWIPSDKDIKWALHQLHVVYQRSRFADCETGPAKFSPGSSVTKLRVLQCPCPSENCQDVFLSPLMNVVQGAGVDEQTAFLMGSALCMQYPDKFQWG